MSVSVCVCVGRMNELCKNGRTDRDAVCGADSCGSKEPLFRCGAAEITRYLPVWPSGQCTRPPCAVEHDTVSGQGSCLSPVTSTYQRIISNNSYAHDEQGVNPRQVRGFDGVLYKL